MAHGMVQPWEAGIGVSRGENRRCVRSGERTGSMRHGDGAGAGAKRHDLYRAEAWCGIKPPSTCDIGMSSGWERGGGRGVMAAGEAEVRSIVSWSPLRQEQSWYAADALTNLIQRVLWPKA